MCMCVHAGRTGRTARLVQWPHSQLLVSLATAMMPMGCWGMSTRSSFMSLPTYLLARCTARRTQSVQKMCSPYTANPKGWTGSDFRITCGNSAVAVPASRGPLADSPLCSRRLAEAPIQSQSGRDVQRHRATSLTELMGRPRLDGEGCAATQLSGNVRAWMGCLGPPWFFLTREGLKLCR